MVLLYLVYLKTNLKFYLLLVLSVKQKKEVGLEAMSDLAYIVYCYLSGNDGSEAIKIKEVLDDFND